MAKIKTKFICQECGHSEAKWMGKCSQCNAWNSFEEEIQTKFSKSSSLTKGTESSSPKKINDIIKTQYARYESKIKEFDRVMGGGVTHGSLTLLGGEPGIGKSTLLMNVCGKLSENYPNEKIFYVSGEESESQVADRGQRLKINQENFYIYNESSWQNILENIKILKPKFFILDSIQTTVSHEIAAAAGTISQIREVTYELMSYAKANGLTCFIIGHVTKEGNIAGPKILEHMVDTVIYFEGDQFGQYRILRAMKNRFGNTNEVGIFEMRENGLLEVSNPSQYFLEDPQSEESFGKSLTCILEGTRPLFVEIQALVVENKFGNARRVTQGIDNNRLALLVAVIDKYFEIPLSFNDIYVNVVGGMKLMTRESDLSIIASLLSSYHSISLSQEIIFIGEVGLTGEVRSVPRIETRLKEIEQLNYKTIITSKRVANEFQKNIKPKLIGIEKASEINKLFFK